ncbi:MAG: hypothetical protein KGH93_00400 [Patescibacteria group bacterium]|nr:hypothetical protein [Patescibacteria group bacterium]MDE1945650.1 hypothetical protein [Patescibacteria group bacterium]
MVSFFKEGFPGGMIALFYFLLFFFIVPLDVACTYHSTSSYCAAFTEKNTLPPFLPAWLLPVDLGFFSPVFATLTFLTLHFTPIDPNDTALIILLAAAIFYLAGTFVWFVLRKIFGK